MARDQELSVAKAPEQREAEQQPQQKAVDEGETKEVEDEEDLDAAILRLRARWQDVQQESKGGATPGDGASWPRQTHATEAARRQGDDKARRQGANNKYDNEARETERLKARSLLRSARRRAEARAARAVEQSSELTLQVRALRNTRQEEQRRHDEELRQLLRCAFFLWLHPSMHCSASCLTSTKPAVSSFPPGGAALRTA